MFKKALNRWPDLTPSRPCGKGKKAIGCKSNILILRIEPEESVQGQIIIKNVRDQIM